MWQRLVKAAGITSAQRQAYLDETERTDLTTEEAIGEETIADYMQDAFKREGFFSEIGRKDPSSKAVSPNLKKLQRTTPINVSNNISSSKQINLCRQKCFRRKMIYPSKTDVVLTLL